MSGTKKGQKAAPTPAEAMAEVKAEAGRTPGQQRAYELIGQIKSRIEQNLEAANLSADLRLRSRLAVQVREFRDELEWLPRALELDDEPVTYGCQDSRGLHMPVSRELVDPPIRFRRNTFTTSDPVAKARIEHHIANGGSPRVERIPDDFVPNFNQKGVFLMWSSREDHLAMIQRDAARPNL